MRTKLLLLSCIVIPIALGAQGRGGGRGTAARENDTVTVLRPARVFDGESMHEGWAGRVRGERIEAGGAGGGRGARGRRGVGAASRGTRAGRYAGAENAAKRPARRRPVSPRTAPRPSTCRGRRC